MNFSNKYSLNNPINTSIPVEFTKYSNTILPDDNIPLFPPDVPEERAFAIYGGGVSMDRLDSDVLPGGPLHIEFKKNESVGESPYSSNYGSRIIKIGSAGVQSNFKPSECCISKSYSTPHNYEMQSCGYLLQNSRYIDYSDNFVPSDNIKLEESPGKYSDSEYCENTLPNVQYDPEIGACLTAGDIPYRSSVNGRVNPRLLSRWQSYTGSYDPIEILASTSDGALYPVIN